MCNINQQLEYLYSFFKPETEGKGLRFIYKTRLTNEASNVKTDKEKLNAILINLIKNAVKFTEKGSIEFGYEVKPKDGNNYSSELEFYVRDSGVGIAPDQKEIIFERFRQGSELLNRNYEGAGLGLSISKSYVEMLGGKIWVEPNTNKKSEINGSIFYFTIPYDPVKKEKKRVKTSRSNSEQPVKKLLNVMIAEDDPASEILFSKLIKHICGETYYVKSGIDAVNICRKNPIDLILMDIKMAGMDGY